MSRNSRKPVPFRPRPAASEDASPPADSARVPSASDASVTADASDDPSGGPGAGILFAAIVLAVAALVAWGNSFDGAFVFDDLWAIERNPSIRSLDPLGAFRGPDQSSVAGRPLVNYSLAISHAMGGTEPPAYHAFNLAIHFLAALALFDVARRTLRRPALADRFAARADSLALAIALLWMAHPIQTQSVTYVIQRAEAMVGLFLVLTLRSFIRFVEESERGREPSPDAGSRGAADVGARRHLAAAVGFSILGMATKESMATAPAILLLWDWFFGAGSVRGVARRWTSHAAVAATWVVLAALMATGPRSATVGGGVPVSPWQYLLTQFGVVTHYLRLALWPDTLVLDYLWPLAEGVGDVAPQAALILGLAAATFALTLRRSPLGFAGAWFFTILSPTSTIVPIADPCFEQRMYLPLAAVVAVAVLGGWSLLSRLGEDRARIVGAPLVALIAVLLIARTRERNEDYRDAVSVWAANAEARPANWRAWMNLGGLHVRARDYERGVEALDRSLALHPENAGALVNRGAALQKLGRLDEAETDLRRAVEIDSTDPTALNALGVLLVELGRAEESLAHFEAALAATDDVEYRTGLPQTETNLGRALRALGRDEEAAKRFRNALAVDPGHLDALVELGGTLQELGRPDEALEVLSGAAQRAPRDIRPLSALGVASARAGELEKAIGYLERARALLGENDAISPEDAANVRNNLGDVLLRAGRAEGVEELGEAVRLAPGNAEYRAEFGAALGGSGRLEEAAEQFAEAVRIAPGSFEHRTNLGASLAMLGRFPEAASQFREAANLRPDDATAHANLAQALERSDAIEEAVRSYARAAELEPTARRLDMLGVALARADRLEEAAARFEEALRVDPNFSDALVHLARARAQSGAPRPSSPRP